MSEIANLALAHGPAQPARVTSQVGDSTPCRAALEAWAADSGMTVPDFEDTYVEHSVNELLDHHPTMRRVDAEHLVLTEAPWLTDLAA